MPAAYRRIVYLLTGALACMPLAGLAASSSAGTNATGGADVVAQAGPITLGGADVRALVANLPASARAAVSTNLDSLEQVIHASLVGRAVLADAKASGFDRQPQTSEQLDRVRDDALVRLWVASQSAVPADYPSDADIQAAYAANQQALASPTQYHIAQIFIVAPDGGDPARLAAALRKAADISSRIASADFGRLAQAQSEDTASAARSGDLGYLPADHILPAILAAVRNLAPGQVVGPVKTSQGLHFLKLLDKKAGTVPTLAEARARLIAALRSQRADQLERAYLTNYSAKIGVTVNQIALAKLQQTLPR